jgi:hypothetical protein
VLSHSAKQTKDTIRMITTFDIKKRAARRRLRYVLAVLGAVILGVLLLAGCGPGSSTPSAQQLVQQNPWLAPLGISFIQGLLQQYGSDLVALLAAAATALFG